jgi:hypothetical protein
MLHFAETREQVLDRLRTLRLARLESDGVYTVYTARAGQDIQSSQIRLKQEPPCSSMRRANRFCWRSAEPDLRRVRP